MRATLPSRKRDCVCKISLCRFSGKELQCVAFPNSRRFYVEALISLAERVFASSIPKIRVLPSNLAGFLTVVPAIFTENWRFLKRTFYKRTLKAAFLVFGFVVALFVPCFSVRDFAQPTKTVPGAFFAFTFFGL
jgi:hypothetical protein